MIKVITERLIPPGFDTTNDAEVARHVRIAVDAMKSLAGRAHWICSYVTEDRLFGVTVYESEADLIAFQNAAGIADQKITVHRVTRVIDPSMAEDRP